MSHDINDHPIIAIGELVALASPAEGAYTVRPSLRFKLSQNSSVAINDMVKERQSATLRIHGFGAIRGLSDWLRTKRATFQHALREKRALHFDILVLGIDERIPPENTQAEALLTDARRQLVATRDQQRGSANSGWTRHVDRVRGEFDALQHKFGILETEFRVETWVKEARRVFSENVHDNWNPLVQYGVRELLFFLYIEVYNLLVLKQEEQALQVLERTIHAAVHCSDPVTHSGASLEALSSAKEATYFHPLPLPPFEEVFGQPRHREDPADLKRILGGDEHHTHGSVAQLGRRAAKHYRVDAKAWASRAGSRWR
ncbi:hypothetical protein JCM10908_005972 [Rhodotorula pacifica]|uniref:uncharacterized protein n=1 Tax=Rhodotorula pacifica TaxID=1495444 RepID=UPI00317A4AF3